MPIYASVALPMALYKYVYDYEFALKSVHQFLKYSVHKLVMDERTNELADGQSDRDMENITPPARLDWRTHKNTICSLTVMHSCFYDAEHILSAIAKFTVYPIGKGDGQRGMEGEGCRRHGNNGGNMERRGTGMHEK